MPLSQFISYAFGVNDVLLKEEGMWGWGGHKRFMFIKKDKSRLSKEESMRQWKDHCRSQNMQKASLGTLQPFPAWSLGQPPGSSWKKIKTSL